MKIFKFIGIALVALVATSCGSSYNEEKCEEVIEKYNEGKRLNEKDYAIALEQCDALLDHYEKGLEKFMSLAKKKDDKALDVWDEYLDDEDMGKNLSKLCKILDDAKLKGDQKEKFKDIEKRYKKVEKDYQKAFEKKYKLEDD